MVLTYYKFWDLLKRRNITQKKLKDEKIVSNGTLAKMKHNQYVSTEVLTNLCNYLQCDINDICQMENIDDIPKAGE